MQKQVTVSIVSHQHCSMLEALLAQLSKCEGSVGHVIITHNVPTDLVINSGRLPFQLTVINNQSALGFAANHNQAFKACSTRFFCVLNPDVEIPGDPFVGLLPYLEHDDVGAVAPTVLNMDGSTADSCRKFPTPMSIFNKALFGKMGVYDSACNVESFEPDWVGGMFILLRSETYAELNGFDEKYFLYYEDIDFCLRVWKMKKKIVCSKVVNVVHNARRDSHRRFKFFLMHLKSMLLFFLKHWLRYPR